MSLNVDFVVIFLSFINRYYLNKRFLLNNNGNIFKTSLFLFNKKEFFILLIYFINLNKLILSSNINYFLIKDYKFFYIMEYYLKFKRLFIKKWFFYFYNWKKYKLCLFSDFKLRINIVLFFTLGKYVEFLRLFFYNEYLNLSNIKSSKKVSHKNNMYININFRKLIFKGIYIFYYSHINKKHDVLSILNLRNKDLIYNKNIYDKYLKYFFLYYRLIYFFFILFINYLRPYYILFSYNVEKIIVYILNPYLKLKYLLYLYYTKLFVKLIYN